MSISPKYQSKPTNRGCSVPCPTRLSHRRRWGGKQQKKVQILERDLQDRQREPDRDKTTSHKSCTCIGPLKTLQTTLKLPKNPKKYERTQI